MINQSYFLFYDKTHTIHAWIGAYDETVEEVVFLCGARTKYYTVENALSQGTWCKKCKRIKEVSERLNR